MKTVKISLKSVLLIFLLLASMTAAACDKTKWRAKEYGTPPSWEHDLGRPDGYGGEPPWR